jgi:PBP1b-binding outer membrane lipoprotein LpoB
MKMFIALLLCFLFLTGCSEPQENSPPQPTTHTTVQQQQAQEQARQAQEEQDDVNNDIAVQASIDMMMSVVNN